MCSKAWPSKVERVEYYEVIGRVLERIDAVQHLIKAENFCSVRIDSFSGEKARLV